DDGDGRPRAGRLIRCPNDGATGVLAGPTANYSPNQSLARTPFVQVPAGRGKTDNATYVPFQLAKFFFLACVFSSATLTHVHLAPAIRPAGWLATTLLFGVPALVFALLFHWL